MKKIILILFLITGLNNYSQNNEKFKPGVNIIENIKVLEYEKPTSILFVFEGHTHMVNNFRNLKKRIIKTFKKQMKKEYKNFKLDFDLNAEKSFNSDLENIPHKKHNISEYKSVCYVALSDFKGWDNHLIEKRKQNYNLNLILKDADLVQLIKLKINVNSFYTIATQNKNLSKIIYDVIMNK